MDVTAHQAAGRLVFHESESYTKSLSFDPNRVIALLIAEAEKAVEQGYPALRVTDEMTWALPGRPGSEKVLEYEAKLNRDFFPRYPCLALCQYHQAKFDAEIIKGAIMTHPLVARGDHIYRNTHYISPDGFLGERRTDHEVERLLHSFEEERENRQRTTGMQEAFKEIAHVIEARDPYSAGHQERVTRLACAIAEEMGLSAEQVDTIRQAGMLHDIGKIHVPVDILTKPGQLRGEEFAEIKAHPEAGSDLLKKMRYPYPIPDIVLQHHERMDGSGYPQGLSGEKILLEARIMAVADVVEAMSLGRSYRDALGTAKALQDISWNKGVLYDADVVDACLRLFTQKLFRFK
jgi:putative nucleotidyltransferase with HDIG domain